MQSQSLTFQESSMSEEQREAVHKFLTKWIVPAAAVIGVFAALFAGIRYIIKAEVADMTRDIGTLQTDIGTLTGNVNTQHTDLGSTNQRIDGLLKDALERAFPKATASKAEVTGSLKQAAGMLQLARSQNIKLNSQLVTAYGRQLTTLGTDPLVGTLAWKTLANVLDYRSFLNVEQSPKIQTSAVQIAPNQKVGDYMFSLNLKPKPGTESGTHWAVRITTQGKATYPGESARLEQLSDPQPQGFGHSQIVIEGKDDTIVLDGQYMKNVAIINAVVEYDGGPVQLDNVYFVNCTFRVALHPNGQLLANAVLKSPAVTVTVS